SNVTASNTVTRATPSCREDPCLMNCLQSDRRQLQTEPVVNPQELRMRYSQTVGRAAFPVFRSMQARFRLQHLAACPLWSCLGPILTTIPVRQRNEPGATVHATVAVARPLLDRLDESLQGTRK